MARQCRLCNRTEKTHRISPGAGLCNPCEVALHYWRNKTPTELFERAEQVESFQNRIEALLGNVRRLPSKRRARR